MPKPFDHLPESRLVANGIEVRLVLESPPAAEEAGVDGLLHGVEADIAKHCDRIISLEDGRVNSDTHQQRVNG